MDSSRRAVESYWRSRTIDAATSDEDKVTPVYKLEEICDLLRSSHVSIVKELSSFILKRLDHKNPIVKQKALRLIKYAVGKSGVEFRREMQRHSVAIRQLFHYKGVSDPLKGDALNKAVRDTAHEAITAIFSEENKPAAPPAEDRNKRIQGFGSTNYEAAPDDRKSFLSEVVGIGSASIKQGISNLTQTHSMKKKDNNGSYKSPNLHRSLTKETGYSDTYDAVDYRARGGTSAETVQWGQDPGLASAETTNGSYSESKTAEERLLETIVTSGGVRLQPTRDAIQIFLGHAVKSNAAALSHAIEIKLQAPHWQVRMKAICVLESILRKKEEEPFSDIAAYFSENSDVVVKCSESPQSSLREKANRVLNLLDRDQTGAAASNSEKFVKADTVNAVPMPDLIDTADPDDFYGTQTSKETQNDQLIGNLTATQAPLIDDLFGDGPANTASASELTNDDDPFSDVSFHTSESKEPVATDDLFSGMTLDSNRGAPELFDIFGSDAGAFTGQETQKTDLEDFMGGLSVNQNGSKKIHEMGTSSGELLPQSLFSDSSSQPTHQVSNDALSGILGPQTLGVNPNFMFPQGAVPVPYNVGPGLMFNPGLISSQQQINYGAMGNIFAQHFATMSNFQQQLGNLSSQNSSGVHIGGSPSSGDYSPAFPDIFQSNYPTQVKNPTLNSSKKEETKAFDFISDHIAAARDPKR